MSVHTPERKIEQALKRYLETVAGTEFAGVLFVTRFNNLVLTEPRIEIVCAYCNDWPENSSVESDSGDWQCEVSITVKSRYEKDVDAVAHDEIAGQVADKIITPTLVADIMATQTDEDITVFDAWRGGRSNSIDGKSLKTEQKLTVFIAPSKL